MSTEWDYSTDGPNRAPLPSAGQDARARPIEASDADQRWGEDLDVSIWADSSMTISGQGQSGQECGDWLPRSFCDECGEVHFGISRCRRRSCEDCASLWSAERAEAFVKRMVAKRHTLEKDVSRRVTHNVASPEPGSIRSLKDVQDGFHDAADLAKEQGVRGFYCVFHGYRVEEDTKREFRQADPDMGIWRWIKHERPEDWRSLTYWSPHYHVIGLCRDLAENKPEQQDGWNFVRIDRRGGRSAFKPQYRLSDKDVYQELAGCVRYLMSHATYESDSAKDCARWYGTLSTASFSPEEELSDGALDTIDRITEEVLGSCSSREDDEVREEEDGEECENCGSKSQSPIWDAFGALADKGWCDRIGRDQERRLLAAAEWRMGLNRPEAGMKHPSSLEQAEEALAALV